MRAAVCTCSFITDILYGVEIDCVVDFNSCWFLDCRHLQMKSESATSNRVTERERPYKLLQQVGVISNCSHQRKILTARSILQ